ncbi:MAG: hypothetical protein PHN88_05000 [Ignavibacteria bacterium]|nr:hypothetical protein [Ignavibacteria bacterium]
MNSALLKIAIVFLLLCVIGCGKSNEKKTGNSKGNNTPEETDGIKLPDDYPMEFHVPAGSRVLSVNISKDGTDIMFQTESSPEKIIADYRKSASDAGYEEQIPGSRDNQTKGTELMFLKQKDKRNVSINITQSRGGDKSIIYFIYKFN